MKACDNCGEKHVPSHWWEVSRHFWHEAPREWGDLKRLAYAAIPPIAGWVPAPVRGWWSRQFVNIRYERAMRQIAEQDLVIQLEKDDPRLAGLMMFISNPQRGDN